MALPRIAVLVLGGGLLLGLAPAVASAGTPARVRIVVGNHHRIPLDFPVVRMATGDPAVAHVQLVNDRELLVLGRRVGRTNLIVWLADGGVHDLALRVERDLSLLAVALRDIHPGITVETVPDRDAVALRGTVPDVRFARAAEATAHEYLSGARNLEAGGERGLLVRADGAAASPENGAPANGPGG